MNSGKHLSKGSGLIDVRHLNVGFWYEPLFPFLESGLDGAGVVIDFRLISCRELIVDYMLCEGRNPVR